MIWSQPFHTSPAFGPSRCDCARLRGLTTPERSPRSPLGVVPGAGRSCGGEMRKVGEQWCNRRGRVSRALHNVQRSAGEVSLGLHRTKKVAQPSSSKGEVAHELSETIRIYLRNYQPPCSATARTHSLAPNSTATARISVERDIFFPERRPACKALTGGCERPPKHTARPRPSRPNTHKTSVDVSRSCRA